jgi:hypothetical protein
MGLALAGAHNPVLTQQLAERAVPFALVGVEELCELVVCRPRALGRQSGQQPVTPRERGGLPAAGGLADDLPGARGGVPINHEHRWRLGPATRGDEPAVSGRHVLADAFDLDQHVDRAKDGAAAAHGVAVLAPGLALVVDEQHREAAERRRR